MDHGKRVLLLRLLPLAAVLSCTLPFGAEEFETVRAWLGCSDCVNGERAAVRSLGRRAVRVMAQVLDTVPASFLEPIRISTENAWSPESAFSREEFVAFYLDNAREQARQRAALTLSDFRAARRLRDALALAEARGYREETLRVIRGALEVAELGTPVVVAVRLAPPLFSLPLGTTASPALFVEDQFGNPLDVPVAWTSSDTLIVAVDTFGVVTPVAVGAATVSATAQGLAGEAVVAVVSAPPSPPRLEILEGNHQEGLVGAILADGLVVGVTDSLGTPLVGVPVLWSVLRGGGAIVSADPATDGSGRAGTRWRLGDSLAPQRLEARIHGAPAVRFRATARPGAPSGLEIEPSALLLSTGQMAVLSALFTDGTNRWEASSVVWSSDDPGVAVVTPSGAVLGVGEGTPSVTAAAGPLSEAVPVLVVRPADEDLDPDTAAVVGRLFLDESPKNDLRDAGEPLAHVPGIKVFLGLGAAGTAFDTLSYVPTPGSTRTDFEGRYAFREVPVGSHRVRLPQGDIRLPAAYSSGAEAGIDVTVAGDGLHTVDLPIDITEQVVLVDVFMGMNRPGGLGDPVPGVPVDLYATAQAADDAIPGTRLAWTVTDAAGRATLRFSRHDDAAQSGGEHPTEVFAVVASLPDPDLVFEANAMMGVRYDPVDSLVVASEPVLLRTSRVALWGAVRMGGMGVPGITMRMFSGDTLAPVDVAMGVTDSSGRVSFMRTFSLADLPDTVYLDLGASGPPASMTATPLGVEGEVVGSFLRYVIDGTVSTVDLGRFELRHLVTAVAGRVYHEADDQGGTVTYTGGDDHDATANIAVTLWNLASGAPVATTTTDASGRFQFPGIATLGFYALTATPSAPNTRIVSDTMVVLDHRWGAFPSGSSAVTEVCPLSPDAAFGATSCHTFAHKFTDGTVQVAVSLAAVYAFNPPVLCFSPDPAVTTPPACRTASLIMQDATHRHSHFTGVQEGTYWVKISGMASPPPPVQVRITGSGDVKSVTFN